MRILIVSNRLPVTVLQDDAGIRLKTSIGGLATGVNSFLKNRNNPAEDYLWFGWPGNVKDDHFQELTEKLAKDHLVPAWLEAEQIEKFYDGFCNQTIWPLFHYFPSKAVYDHAQWQSYVQANEIFCNAILKIIRPDDVIWIHDYHLMLLPQMLRNAAPQAQIGFFLHIPFPAFEVFRIMPWSSEILNGLLGSDLIGFHTNGYARSFNRCVDRILKYNNNGHEISLPSRTVKTGTFAMGIDFQKFNDSSLQPEIANLSKALKDNIRDKKVILSVDRLDYSKGILNRLISYEKFLELHTSWHRKVIFYLVVAPSRIKVNQYLTIKKKIDEAVGRINGKFGQFDWNPVSYQYQSLSFENLTALYSESDVLLVTPLRDGMNLIAKEYVASKYNKTGVLVLSEMAGAAKELDEAILVNPNDSNAMINAIHKALTMPVDEQMQRMEKMQSYLKSNDVIGWAQSFLSALTSNTVHKKLQSQRPYIIQPKSDIQDEFLKGR